MCQFGWQAWNNDLSQPFAYYLISLIRIMNNVGRRFLSCGFSLYLAEALKTTSRRESIIHECAFIPN